jgi:uncharacterized protein YciI
VKHFILEGEYLAPFEEFGELIAEHRAFLQRGYDAGHFLCSGPQIPAQGGFLVARAESREKLQELLSEEPYTRAKQDAFLPDHRIQSGSAPAASQGMVCETVGRRSREAPTGSA